MRCLGLNCAVAVNEVTKIFEGMDHSRYMDFAYDATWFSNMP